MRHDQKRRLQKARAARDASEDWRWFPMEFHIIRIDCLYRLLAKIKRERDEARAALADMAIELHKLRQK